MTWARNTFLNLIILFSGLSALLLIPRLLKSSQIGLQGWLFRSFESHYPEESLRLLAVICEAIIIVRAGRNLRLFKHSHEEDNSANAAPGFGYTAKQIQNWIIVPALFAAALCSARLWGLAVELSSDGYDGLFIHLLGLGAIVTACFVLLTYLQWRGGFVECYLRERRRSAGQVRIAVFLCFFLPLLVPILNDYRLKAGRIRDD